MPYRDRVTAELPTHGVKLCRRFLTALFGSLFLHAVSLAADAAAQTAPTPPTAWQVYEIFHRSCADCHGGHLAKPKGKFGYILDLPRLVEEGKITAGDADNSDLFAALVSTDDEEKMPPPDSEGPKLSTEDIEVVRAWINAGASIGEKPAAQNAAPSAAASAPEVAARRPLGQKLGRLHPLLVHFPIALLLAAFVAESLSRLRPRYASSWQSMTRGSLWLATLGGVAAAICGWLNAAYEGYASGEVEVHRWLGVTTAALALVTLAACEYAERARDATRGGRGLLLGLLVLSAIIVALAGHTGGAIAYGADYLGF